MLGLGSLLYLGYNILLLQRIQFLHGLFHDAVVLLLLRVAYTGLPRSGSLERHDDAVPADNRPLSKSWIKVSVGQASLAHHEGHTP